MFPGPLPSLQQLTPMIATQTLKILTVLPMNLNAYKYNIPTTTTTPTPLAYYSHYYYTTTNNTNTIIIIFYPR